MKTKITEKQLRQLVRESLEEVANENQNDEGFWGGLKGAAKGLGQAAKGEWNKLKRGVMDNGLNNEYKGQSIGDRFKTAGKQIKTGFKGGDKQQELANIEKALLKLQDTQSFGGETILKTENQKRAFVILLKAVRMAKQGSVGGVNAAAANRYGAPKQAAQSQEPQQKVALEESKLDRIIRESIKKALETA